MRKFLLAAGIVCTVVACNSTPEGYTISGDLRGEIENGTAVYLKTNGENNQPADVDTTTVENGKFEFTGAAAIPQLHYIFVDKLPGYTPLVLENGEIVLSAQKDSLPFAEVKGPLQNTIFTNFTKKSKDINERAMSIQEDMKNASTTRDEATITALREEMNELRDEYQSFETDFIKENPNGLISALLIERSMATKTSTYQEAKAMYDSLTPEIKETQAAKKVSEKLEELKKKEENAKSTDIGATAPDFSAPDPSGTQLSLNSVKGKLTLVDFWAAWCRPCRAENPNIVKVYEKYHDKGLNVLGVSLDRKEEDWKKAIADDGLVWNHVSNLAYFNDEIAKLYNVDAIPAAFLLDENGVIVAKNLRGAALESKVAELLN